MEPHGSEAGGKPWRMNGLLFMVLLVVVGMGVTSVLFRLRAGKLGDDMSRTRAEMPADPEQRLERWLAFGRALVDQRLVQLRLSARQPWLVTHTVSAERNSAEQEIWGVDLAHLTTAATTREGLKVVISLPEVRLLAHGPIGGDKALSVPHYAPGDVIPPAEARARYVVEWSLERLTAALRKDIAGSALEVRFGAARDG